MGCIVPSSTVLCPFGIWRIVIWLMLYPGPLKVQDYHFSDLMRLIFRALGRYKICIWSTICKICLQRSADLQGFTNSCTGHCAPLTKGRAKPLTPNPIPYFSPETSCPAICSIPAISLSLLRAGRLHSGPFVQPPPSVGAWIPLRNYNSSNRRRPDWERKWQQSACCCCLLV